MYLTERAAWMALGLVAMLTAMIATLGQNEPIYRSKLFLSVSSKLVWLGGLSLVAGFPLALAAIPGFVAHSFIWMRMKNSSNQITLAIHDLSLIVLACLSVIMIFLFVLPYVLPKSEHSEGYPGPECGAGWPGC